MVLKNKVLQTIIAIVTEDKVTDHYNSSSPRSSKCEHHIFFDFYVCINDLYISVFWNKYHIAALGA